MARAARFVAIAVPKLGWRIWDRMQKKWWGNPYPQQPSALIAELNRDKNPERITELSKGTIFQKPKAASRAPKRQR